MWLPITALLYAMSRGVDMSKVMAGIHDSDREGYEEYFGKQNTTFTSSGRVRQIRLYGNRIGRIRQDKVMNNTIAKLCVLVVSLASLGKQDTSLDSKQSIVLHRRTHAKLNKFISWALTSDTH